MTLMQRARSRWLNGTRRTESQQHESLGTPREDFLDVVVGLVPRRSCLVEAALAQRVALVERMRNENGECVFIHNHGRLVGVVTAVDLMHSIDRPRDTEPRAFELMRPSPAATPRTSLRAVLGEMRRAEVPACPLIDEAGTILGVVTIQDVTEWTRRAGAPGSVRSIDPLDRAAALRAVA